MININQYFALEGSTTASVHVFLMHFGFQVNNFIAGIMENNIFVSLQSIIATDNHRSASDHHHTG